jgi:hypothetical protein
MAVQTLTDDKKFWDNCIKEKIKQLIYEVEPIKFNIKTTDYIKQSIEEAERLFYRVEPIKFDIKTTDYIDFVRTLGLNPTNPWAVVKLNNEKENEKMDAKKCDRCGKLFELKDATRWIDVPFAFCLDNRGDKEEIFKKYSEEYIEKEYLTKSIGFQTSTDTECRLCPECRQAFANWWKLGATRTTKES